MTETLETIQMLIIEFLPSITITSLNVLLPAVFQIMVRGEIYTPAFVIKITLMRFVVVLHNILINSQIINCNLIQCN